MAEACSIAPPEIINDTIIFGAGAVKPSGLSSSNRYVLHAKGRPRKFKKSHRDGR
jgi:hypothetical protein